MPMTLTVPRNRTLLLAGFLASAGLMIAALFFQYQMGLAPCPLCIVQRYAFVLAGLIALVAALHGPRRVGVWIYGVLAILASGAGAAVAGRQIWLQYNPPKTFDCGPGLDYMLESFPLTQVLPKLFKGEGDCAKVVWRFLGLSIPEWALVWFVALIALACLAAVKARRA